MRLDSPYSLFLSQTAPSCDVFAGFFPDNMEKPVEMNSTGDSWVWFPSWLDLKTHYLKELGFLASLAQFCGATIFWVSGVLSSSKVGVADVD